MAKIAIASKDKVLKEIELHKTIIIGREKGDIILKNPTVSAKHMKLEKMGHRFIVHDLESTNGTFVNEERITTKEIRSGDVITVGRFKITFDNPDEEPETVEMFDEGQDAAGMTMMMDSSKLQEIMAKKPLEAELAPKTAAKLFLHQSSGAPKVVTLEKETTMIGSSDNSDIQIKGITIGRVAASINRTGDQYEIIYQGGMAKLKVGAKPTDRRVLENGDKFSIGSYNFEFRTEL